MKRVLSPRFWVDLLILCCLMVLPCVSRAAADPQAPTCRIRAHYVEPKGSATKFTFIVAADDNVEVKRLEFRETIAGIPLGDWNPWPKELGNTFTFTLDCDQFQFQVRAVDTSGNLSPAQALSFEAPFPNKPQPEPQPLFAKPKLVTGYAANTWDLKVHDVDGDGIQDFIRADLIEKKTEIRFGDGKGGVNGSLEISFGNSPSDTALGRVFGPTGSAANDERPDLAVASGAIQLFVNNGGSGASGLQMPPSDIAPEITAVSSNFYAVAIADLNADGFDDIVGAGTGVDDGGSSKGVAAVFLNRGIVNGAHEGFETATRYFEGKFFIKIQAADIDQDGDIDLIAMDQMSSQIVIWPNQGNGIFGTAAIYPTQYQPNEVAIGDLTNDGIPDVAIYGQKYLTESSTVVAGLEVLRNSRENPGTLVSVDAYEFYRVANRPANVFLPGDLLIADVTLDGVPEIVFANSQEGRVDIVRLASIRNAQGKFVRFELEGATKIALQLAPMQLAIGRLNSDSKPDVVSGNFGPNQLAILLNVKGGKSKPVPLTLSIVGESDTDSTGKITVVGDEVDYTVGFSNDSYDDAQDVRLSCIVPPGLDVEFVDENEDDLDDRFGFDPIYTKGRITAVSWEIGNLPIGGAGQKRFKAVVSDAAKIGANLVVNAKVRSNGGSRSVKSPKLRVITSLTVEATAQQTTVHPGGLVEYRIKVKNRAAYPAKNVYVFAPIPNNAALQLDFLKPAFLGTDFQPTVPIDGITGKPVATPTSAPFIEFFSGQPINPGWTTDRRQVAWFLGGMKPKSEQLLRFFVRMVYDGEPSGSLTLQKLTAFQLILGSKKGPFGIELGTAEQLGSLPTSSVVPAPPGANRPKLAFVLQQDAAGTLTDTATGERLVTVTTGAKAIPGTTPARKTNEIEYTATYANIGTAVAGYLRAHLLIPPGTKINRSSVLVDNVPVPSKQVKVVRYDIDGLVEIPEYADEETEGAFLLVTLPFLEANFPAAPGSAKTVKYRVALSPKTRINDELACLGFVQSDELRDPVFTTPTLARARVVLPVILEKLKAQRTPAFSSQDNELFTVDSFFRNSGGIAATSVEVIYDVPAGAKFSEAFYLDENLQHIGGQVQQPAPGASSGLIRFNVGTLAPGAIVRTRVFYRTNQSTAASSGAGANRVTPRITVADSSNRFVARAERHPISGSTDRPGSSFEIPIRTQNRTFIAQKAPRSARPGEEITFTLFWGNLSSAPAGAGGVTFPIPENTTFVRATPTVALTSFNNGSSATYNPDTRALFWGTTAVPHHAVIATVTVRVNDQPTSSAVLSQNVNIRGDQSSLVTAAPVSIPITGAGGNENAIIGSLAGGSAQVAIGNAFDVSAANIAFQNDVQLVTTDSAIFGIGGADYLHLKSGPIVIPLGGGNIVAAGAGNIVAAGGGNIVAARGGNIVAAGGGNIVAAGAGNIITAGAGNLIGIQGTVANLTQPNLYNLTASIVAAGGGNLLPGASIVAAGGGNIVAAGGGNIVAAGGGNLIGPDGATLISNVNGALLAASLNPQISGVLGTGVDTGMLVSSRLGGLVGQDGATIASVSTGSLVQGSSGGLIGNNGNTLIGPDGATLIGPDGGSLIGNNGNTLVAAGAGNIVAAGGGNIVGNGGAGFQRSN